ncbi:MAG: YARHG domain-containing protein [Eubacteriales bacterium]|nr:YARHG domain-containing protein [Eubacteriales bacterium]
MCCPNCNRKIETTWVRCPYCGSALKRTVYNNCSDRRNGSRKARERRNAIIALIIGVILALLLLFGIWLVFGMVTSKENDTESHSKVVQTETTTEKVTEKIEEKSTEKETQPASKKQTEKTTESTKDGLYILNGSDTRALTSQEVAALSSEERQMAINEIYARHGRRFNDSSIQAYFDSRSWYKGTVAPENFSDSVFSQTELDNINLLASDTSSASDSSGISFIGLDVSPYYGTYTNGSGAILEIGYATGPGKDYIRLSGYGDFTDTAETVQSGYFVTSGSEIWICVNSDGSINVDDRESGTYTGNYYAGGYTAENTYTNTESEYVGYYVDYESGMTLSVSSNGDGTYTVLCYYEDGRPYGEHYDCTDKGGYIANPYINVCRNDVGNVGVTSGIGGVWGNFIKQ